MLVLHENIKNVPKSRVELHVHLDGAVRAETAWELRRQKSLPLPGDGSLASFTAALKVGEPKDLSLFLAPFDLVLPAIQGDLEAIERVAREFVEDRSRDHVAYCEARFCPHFLLPREEKEGEEEGEGSGPPVTTDAVVEAVLRGVEEGVLRCPGTDVKLLLCCIRGFPEWSWDVLRLCEEYRDRGVLGLDIAGSHAGQPDDGGDYTEGREVFQAAEARGIQRTVHAGEDAPAASVEQALDVLKACRIGHGYRVLEDPALLERCRREGVHFEVCPTSSYLTGAIGSMQTASKQHPVIRFAEAGISFSINTDDPLMTGTSLTDEYDLLRSWGFTEALFARANFSAAQHSFLPPEEKQALLKQLREAYGVPDLPPPTPPTPSPAPSPDPSPSKLNITVSSWDNRE